MQPSLTPLEQIADAYVADAERWYGTARDYERWGLAPEAADARERARGAWVESLACGGQIAVTRYLFGDRDPFTVEGDLSEPEV